MLERSGMAPPAVNPWVAEALSHLFGSEEGADCDIQFCLEGSEEAGRGAALGPLLPAHPLVLRPACERFRAQLDRWEDTPPASKRAKSGEEGVGRPLLRVPLGSEAELPAARLAVRFAYTGQVHASSVREALEVLRAGDYLAIEGCAAACSQWLADRLAATGAAEADAAEPPEPAVLQLYACEDLWPAANPSFGAVLSAAKAQLVQHFGSTLTTLNTLFLRQQLLALPATGLEALLESDDLGTDSEDGVLTLLATWMRANWARTYAATRKRLCGLVQLTQLSPQAVSCLLLPLAADFEAKGPEEEAGWFPMTATDAQLVVSHLSAPELWQQQTREEQASAGAPGWHSSSPRKQCVPEAGLPFPWSLSKEELRAKLEGLQPGQKAQAFADVMNGGTTPVFARGLVWRVRVDCTHGKAAAGLYLSPQIPAAYTVPGSRLAGPVPKLPTFIDARLSVNRLQGGAVSAVSITTYNRENYIRLGVGRGVATALPLSPQQPAALAAPSPVAAAAGGDDLAPWAEYAHEGSAVTGTLTLLLPEP
ncbi:hypothetical protein HYH03_005793 [Edaphochlamys debaryana]|uniref:BACK domain-containing protein n=1 Tax=Edaphochlamys debaryana TaxID=47281 RepID=A0A835Y7I8_9CHLO|nr:hypothetical protein HYH03_005793 [Edaphochlamys debaryana]|eukprot:KAG2496193.1 hypothetical protein HYH03_005793 [Edaphochlamys debaryana]